MDRQFREGHDLARKPSFSATTDRKTLNYRPWLASCLVLLICGASYRVAMGRFRPLMTERINLPVPLSDFPLSIGGWTGEEKPLTADIERIAGNDDYLSRLYRNASTGEWASLYVAYSARPRTMVGHQPQVCYRNAGWIGDGFASGEVPLDGGGALPCLIHRFHRGGDSALEIVVLNYYVLNGVGTNDEASFAGVGWRLPNINGNPAWYVAQIQISSNSEASVRRLAEVTGSQILNRLPDKAGRLNISGSPAEALSNGLDASR
jgi:hypothetical protein